MIRKLLLFALLITSVISVLYMDYMQSDQTIKHDEVDYVYCAEKGIVHNAFGFETLSLKEFIHLGKLKVDKDSSAIREYAKSIYNPNEDVFVLRHYHPPGPVYYWSLFTGADRLAQITSLRYSNGLLILLSGLLFYLAFRGLKIESQSILVGLGMWSILVLSDLFAYSFSSLNFHNFLALSSVFSAYAMIRYVENTSRKNLLILAISIASMLLVLESSLFMIIIMVLGALFFGWYKCFTWKKLILLIAVSLLITTVLWPAFISKSELVKSFGMYFARIFVNDNLEYNDIDYLGEWLVVVKMAPIFFATLAVLQIAAIRSAIKERSTVDLLPYLMGWSYCLLMTPFVLNKTYIFPGVMLLSFGAALTLTRLARQIWTTWIVAGVLLSSIVYMNLTGESHREDFSKGGDLSEDRVEVVKGLIDSGKVLAFPGHVYQYYLGNSNIDALGHGKANHYRFVYRYNYDRQDISHIISKGEYQSVVLPNRENLSIWYERLRSMGFEEEFYSEEQLRVFTYPTD